MPHGRKQRIASNGEIGPLLAGIDAASPLGPMEEWSQALLATIDLMLSSRAEIVLFWGDQFCALYNEAYAPTWPAPLGRSTG